MQNLATKLKGFHKTNPTRPSSAIFGEVNPISKIALPERSKLRIGLWPIQSKSDPFLAMGLGMLLGFLLDRWPSIQVYRLPAQVEGEPQDYIWSIQKSQFGVDDWELDELDENAAVWGAFEQIQSQYSLTLEIENDLAEDTGSIRTWKAESLADLVSLFPQISEEIATYLGAGDIDSFKPVFQSGQWEKHNLKQLLKAMFDWELNLFLKLWGKNWTDEQILADYKKLFALGQPLNNGFGDWVTANVAARLLSPLYPSLNNNLFLLEHVEKISLEPTTGLIYRHIIALCLYQVGYTVRVYDLLELNVEYFPESLISWLILVDLYWQNGEIGTALNSIQRSILTGNALAPTYVRYAEMLLSFDASNLVINSGTQRTASTGKIFAEDYIFIDPDDVREYRLLHEAVEAYRAALQLEPNNTEVLSHLIIQLIDLQENSLWAQFEKLVKLDWQSFHLRNVIEAMSSLDDLEPAIKILSAFVKQQPDPVQIHLSLASVYILDDQNDKARIELEIAQSLNNDSQITTEIERMLLSADDPDFDARLGEITDLLNAGNKIRSEDVEFLELTVENAPTFATGYILLANAYLIWNEITDALDTLLDGQRQLPDDPDISTLLGKALWQGGETQLAFDCLNKSFAKTPNHVPTLALLGRFLFEDGQEGEARLFLARAEAIDPRNAFLSDARIYITSIIK